VAWASRREKVSTPLRGRPLCAFARWRSCSSLAIVVSPVASSRWNVASMTTEGECLCGVVRYAVGGPFNMMIHCHCSMCRKHHGAAFATFVAAPLMGFRWTSGADAIGTYKSSEQGARSFCTWCGSVTPTLAENMDLAICPAGNLRGELGVRPQSHLFVGSKAPWYSITDGLPQHEEYPPEFGATGLARPQIEPRAGIVEGSCLCGAVAFEISGPSQRMVNCHCSRCRRGRSAAHATNVAYPSSAFRFTRGAQHVVEYKVPEARFFAVAHCKTCGSAVPRVSQERGIAIVPAGSLDTDPGVRPTAHIYVGSKAGWFTITDELTQHENGPPA
jgi:hypothetical protein